MWSKYHTFATQCTKNTAWLDTIFIQLQVFCLVSEVKLHQDIQKKHLIGLWSRRQNLEAGQKLIDGAPLPSDGHEIVKVAIRGRNILQRR